ncbi:MAG: DUF2796 domain-containing protein [Hyphomicrobiaceae bacterium]
MKSSVIALATAAGLAAISLSAVAQEEHRQLKAHVHGHGTLNIAIEGKTVEMELEVPGADIVGFEHAAHTAGDKAALKKAKGSLAKPAGLFRLSPAARCRLVSAKVEIEGGDAHGHAHDGDKGKADNDHAHAGEMHHSEFHATYRFTCASPERLTVIGFDYFKAFAGARDLDVNISSPKGQSKFEVTRDKPQLDLRSLM